MQMPLYPVESDWTPPNVSTLPDWNTTKRVAIDVETKDVGLAKSLGPGVRRSDSYIVGYSFALEDGPSYYVPLRHEAGGNVNVEAGLQYLSDQAKNFEGDVVGANLSYDVDWLLQEDIHFKKYRFFRDVQIADPLINELHYRYNLDVIAQRHGFEGKDETILIQAAKTFGLHPKDDLWKLHSKYVGAYAERDANLPLKISRKQEQILEKQDLWDVYNLESELLPCLVRMRRRGILIDQDKLEQISKWSIEQELKCLQQVKHYTNYDIGLNNITKAEIVAIPLRQLGLHVPLTASTKKASIKDEYLATLDHPVAAALQRARKLNKLRNTFVASIKRYMVKGRIHTTLNQLRYEKDDGSLGGAAYGRMSSSDPNLQQQPSKDKDPEIGGLWRTIYIPEPGAIWTCDDFSQQEPRWVVHAAEKFKLPKAKEAGDKYRENPDTDNHKMMAKIAGIDRSPAKVVFLALIYGMGGATLSRKLGLPTKWIEHWKTGDPLEVAGDEAQAIIDKFNEEVPFVTKLAKKAKRSAEANGFIKTYIGRKCHFPQRTDGKFDWTHKALNRYVQGSSGDQMKRAIINVDREGYFLQLSVHDELDGSSSDKTEAKKIGQIMIDSVTLTVPMKVDVEVGPNWANLTKLKEVA